jgi:hypothetical protein
VTEQNGLPAWSPHKAIQRFRWILSVLALAIVCGELCSFADDPLAQTTSPATESLVGVSVNVTLQSGKTLKGVVIAEVRPGNIPGTVVKLRVTDAETGAMTILGAAAVAKVTGVDGKELLVFDTPSKTLVQPNSAQLAAIHQAAEKSAAETPAPRRAKDRATKLKKGGKAEVDDDVHRKEREAKRIEYFKKTGVWLWPELTEEQQKERVVEQKKYLDKVAKKFSTLNMKLYETRHFLFLSDLSPQWVPMYTSCLDAMHNQLCTAYAIKDKDSVWQGKLPVIAFADSLSFEECEKTFFGRSVSGKSYQGLAHKSSNGDVVVTCHCGVDPYYFAIVLVHETTHGFNHRYKSAVQLPNWLDEGIAEWSAMSVVQKNTSILHKVQVGLTQAKEQGNLGGDFFTVDHIDRWQYGIATSMVGFLLKSDGKAFRKMLEAIKHGTKWEDALKDAYGVTPAELTTAFGKTVGIPNLHP